MRRYSAWRACLLFPFSDALEARPVFRVDCDSTARVLKTTALWRPLPVIVTWDDLGATVPFDRLVETTLAGTRVATLRVTTVAGRRETSPRDSFFTVRDAVRSTRPVASAFPAAYLPLSLRSLYTLLNLAAGRKASSGSDTLCR